MEQTINIGLLEKQEDKENVHTESHQQMTKNSKKKALCELIDNAKKYEKAFTSEYLNTT